MSRFLITGASGRLGASALHHLVRRVDPGSVTALVRSQADATALAGLGVECRFGDYDDPASLERVFVDVERVLFISSPVLDPETRLRQHRAVIHASSDVEHVVYTSARGAEYDPAHRFTEAALGERGAVILRNSLYTEPFVQDALLRGLVADASAGAAVATASIHDLGAAAARALVEPLGKRLWELRGPSWTFEELSATLRVPRDEVDAEGTGQFAPLVPLIRSGALADSSDDLEEILGRTPEDIRAVASRLAP
ncbi:NAD(P)H dehydrogenase (quinone) [Leifsonia sp. AK011]|uniref:NAD(P)H-binding protein n=1 Tax=Leifsonia sp. AK011 TaxID=2723075 RepID=UPI0015CAA5A2|nr:NAD(P)H-binding protein [Leifsonia sp. AK011]NYF11127.1 NAD(P)H dehydrogenase (quinone) [Leifsonia sp. AK011]